ncbi:hypothetical protein CDLVIII_2861 [Clostridium sp. DL-VIII]|uniref:DUF4179 domain-containing protein n=1 Tax=Clostridium sp. DL-VIII TaxID=641107 RepID=UPI00023AFBA1|nr:DUF4179 domain-containing protein [Clostridium sp. DL-VIII]EHI99459.1 hypothetical protein CDLVIII_2861 [Clostridium sp. DL-VIII]
MLNRKISRILGPVLGSMAFALIIGVMELTPAYADDTAVNASVNNLTVAATTTSAGVTYAENKDYFVNINKSQVQNGIKVTVDKAVATKKDMEVILKIESDKPIDKVDHSNSIFEVTYGNYDNDFGRAISRQDNIDDKTMTVTLEKYNYDGEYSSKGDMRVDIVLANYKVNIGMDIPVDFTESFNNILDKDISGKIPGTNYNLNKLEADALGTRIGYTRPEGNGNKGKDENALWNSAILLKTGDRMYRMSRKGGYSEKDGVGTGNYEIGSLSYDKVKNEKNISLIPLICNLTPDEMNKLYEDKDENNVTKDLANNISYEKEFNFTDGTKGEIYNIERKDNTIKVYCAGQSEEESLLMACNINMHYENANGKVDSIYYDNKNVSFYKDANKAFGYILEFNNVEKDKPVALNIDKTIKQADKFKLEDEISLLK